MLDPIHLKTYGNSKPGVEQVGYRATISNDDKNLKNKLAEDEEFYRIMELIKTERNETIDYIPASQTEIEPDLDETEELSYFMLFMFVCILVMAKIIQVFQNVIMKVKDLFDQSFPYIWNWMKNMTRGTYAVADGKVGLFLLCVPLLTMFLFLYCSLLTFNALTELLLSNAPSYVTQMVVTEKLNKLLSRQRLQL